MGKKSFQHQHRPEKESKLPTNKQMAELKSENQKLRRKLARADKEIARLNGMVGSYEIEDEMPEAVVTISEVHKDLCPKCLNVELKIVELGSREFEVCPDCKYRKLKSA